MDVYSGDILAIVNYPDYDQNVLTDGKDREKINQYINDPLNPFLDRISDGLYTPGSIVKPYIAFAALAENIISPEKEILSTKQMEVPNPFDPNNPSYFSDWKAHGYVDLTEALAYSSNIYFYQIGGGFGDQQGLGISKINEYLKKFGFTEEIETPEFKGAEGVVPNPEWKEENFNDIWRIGDTYFTSIGQYGFQVTPLQIVRAVSAIANEGTLIEPRLIADTMTPPKIKRQIDFDSEIFKEIKKGMREAVEYGTAKGLLYEDLEVAAKTGTAELGVTKEKVNSWTTGFFPYENPRYAFTIVLERGQRSNLIGGVAATRGFLDWLRFNKPEYLK
jgi:penicillin-binding protein 2